MNKTIVLIATLLAGCGGNPGPYFLTQEAIDAAQKCLDKGDYPQIVFNDYFGGRDTPLYVRCEEDKVWFD